MRVRIDSKANDGLAVIPELPNISPCLIEGRNGIGKTVAIQLLELISGTMPEIFTRQEALWRSLRERLNDTTVTIDGLKGDHKTIAVTFTPDLWPTKPPSDIADWLASVTIDHEGAEVSQAAALLAVTRIAGTEDLEQTLRNRVQTIQSYLESAALATRRRGDEIDEVTADLRADLERANLDELARDEQLMKQAEEQQNAAKEDAAAAARRRDRLASAVETQRQLDAASKQSTALLDERETLTVEIRRLEGELVEAEKVAHAAEEALAAEGDAGKKLADAERLLRTRGSRLAKAERELEDHASALQILPELKTIAAALKEVATEIEQLTERRQGLDATTLVRDVIGEITVPLQTARDKAGAQILIRLPDRSLTVADTFDGVAARGAELADEPTPEAVRDLIRELAAATERRTQLQELGRRLEGRDRARELVEQAAKEAEEARKTAAVASGATESSREANRAVGATQEALTVAHAKLALAQQQLGAAGMKSAEDAEQDLREALMELDLTDANLDDALETARAALATADRVLDEATGSVSAVRRRLSVRRAEIDLAVERVASTKYEWLTAGIPDITSTLQDPEQRYAGFAQIRAGVLAARDRAYATAEFLTGLVGVAQDFFAGDARSSAGSQLVQRLRPTFEAVLGQQLRDALNQTSIRAALFDGAEVVAIDPSTRQLTLRTSDGQERSRSMEAFSTGERAFAFTQARILEREPSAKQNRLLVLDEFGAFVAADRLPDLAAFLTEHAYRVADQIIVILPLHVDYEAEVGETRGDLRQRYDERIKQLKKRDYCAVPLT